MSIFDENAIAEPPPKPVAGIVADHGTERRRRDDACDVEVVALGGEDRCDDEGQLTGQRDSHPLDRYHPGYESIAVSAEQVLDVAVGEQSGSLTQKEIDLLEKPSTCGFVSQEEVIPPRKRYEPSTGNPCCHLSTRIHRTNE